MFVHAEKSIHVDGIAIDTTNKERDIMAANPTPLPSRVGITLIPLAGLIAISLIGILLPTSFRIWIWIGSLLLLAFFVIVVGRCITGSWLGVLIDNRRKMSLSRLQAILWGILILSALLAAALTNLPLMLNPTDALSISVPPELLAILGISVTSLAGASVILNTKKPELVDRNGDGTDPSDRPSWSDMFKGDDVANADSVDLSKVQMFYFTFILVLVYGGAIAVMLMTVDPKHPTINALPALTSSIVWLLGISQAGYLTYKAIPRVPSGGSQAAAEKPPAANLVPVEAVPPVPSTLIQN